jgi:hypothetical protein
MPSSATVSQKLQTAITHFELACASASKAKDNIAATRRVGRQAGERAITLRAAAEAARRRANNLLSRRRFPLA